MTARGARWFIAGVCALAIALAGCAASPTTTYTDAAGEQVTVNWRDYPADAYTDAADVLALPAVEDVDARWRAIRADLVTAIEAEFAGELPALRWAARGDDGWYPYEGNGYGGDSMLRVYNSASWEADVIIPRDEWPRVSAAATAALAKWGIAPSDSSDPDDPAARDLARWLHYTDYFAGGEFLTVSVLDATLDHEALADTKEYGHQIAGISLFYGIQTISRGERDEFTAAAEPFEGLTRPEATHSD